MDEVFTITLRKRAVKEYLEAIIWYRERSLQAAENFVRAEDVAFTNVTVHPLNYGNTYKQFREIKVQKFPYAIVYFIDNKKNEVVITTVFHYKRNPKMKF